MLEHTLKGIQVAAAKFGASVVPGTHRVFVKVTGCASVLGSTLREGIVGQALDAYGVGYEAIKDVSPTVNYPNCGAYIITVIAIDNQSNEQVRQIVMAALLPLLSDVTAEIVSGQAASGGGVIDTLNNALGGAGTAGTIAGLTVGTMLLLAVAGIVIIPLLLQPQGRRRY